MVSIEPVSILYKLSGISGQLNPSANRHVRSFVEMFLATQHFRGDFHGDFHGDFRGDLRGTSAKGPLIINANMLV